MVVFLVMWLDSSKAVVNQYTLVQYDIPPALRCKMILQGRPRAVVHENVEPFPVELLDELLGNLDT